MEVDVIRQLTVRARTEGLDEYQRKIKAVAGAEAEHAAAIERKDRYALGAQRTVDKTLRSLDAEYRAQVQFLSVARGLERAQAQGAVSLDQHNRLLDLARQKYFNLGQAGDNLAKSTGRSSAGLQQLGYQLNDVATQLASGTSLMQTAAQQGGQIYQALTLGTGRASDGLKGMASALGQGTLRMGAFLRTGPGVAGAVAGIGLAALAAAASWRSLQRELANGLDGLGKASGASLDLITRQAGTDLDPAKMSRNEASRVLGSIYGTGKIGPEIGGQLKDVVPDLSKRLGIDLAEAGKLAAKAFADPTKGAEELAQTLGHLDDRTLQTIRSLQAQGNALEAQRVLMERYKASTKGAADTDPWYTKLYNRFTNNLSNRFSNVGRDVDRLMTGGTPQDQLAIADADVAKASKNLSDAMSKPFTRPFDFNVLVERLTEAETRAAGLRAQMQKVADESADAAREMKSLAIGQALGRFNSDVQQRRDLSDQERLIREALADPKMLEKLSMTAEEAGLALARVTAASKTFETSQQRLTADYNLNLAAINARTLGDRAAVEQERARLSALRDKQSADEANTAATRAYTLAIQTATRTLQDQLRDSQRDLNLIGKFGIQRDLQQLRNERDKELEQNRLTPSGMPRVPVATTPAATGMDADFRRKLQALIDAVGGIRITDGFRTFKDQADLYARKPHLAAPPGRSNHEFGLAADLGFDSPEARAEAHRRAAEFGLRFPMLSQAPGKKYEPWHVEPIDARAIRAGLSASPAGSGTPEALIRERFANKEQLLLSEREQGPLRDAKLQLEAQIALQQRLGSQLGLTAREIDQYNESERLRAQYSRDNIAIGPGLNSAIEDQARKFADAQEAGRRYSEQLRQMNEWNSLASDSFKGFASDLRRTGDAGQAFSRVMDRVIDKMLDDLAKMIFMTNQPGGGLFGQLFKGLGLFGGTTASPGFGSTSATAVYHAGTLDGDKGHRRLDNPLAYIGAPRFHTGLASNEFRAILEHGEQILNKPQQARVGAMVGGLASRASQPVMIAGRGAPIINITNNGPSQPEVSHRQDNDGRDIFDIVVPGIEDRMAAKMSRGQGPLARATESRANRTNLRG